MTKDFEVPASIEAVIQDFESRSTPFDEMEVYSALTNARAAIQAPSAEANLGAWIEMMSFGLSPERNGPSPWGTYFGPWGSESYKDGTVRYFPDIKEAPPSTLAHWEQRLLVIKHPVLRARYADLAWDVGPPIGKVKRNVEHARAAVDSYMVSAMAAYRPESYNRMRAIERALDLSVQIKDLGRAACAKDAYLSVHREVMVDLKGWWAAAFDRLMAEKNAGVTDEERQQLIDDLEAVVERCSDTSHPNSFNPHDVQHAAERLVKHYAKLKRYDDVKRIHRIVAESFERFASYGDAMLAAAVLQDAVNSYRLAGMPEESQRVRVLMQEKANQSREQMKSISTELRVSRDTMEEFLQEIVTDNLGSTFARIASNFLTRRDKIDRQLETEAESAPLVAHMPFQIMADDHVVATVGSLEDDPFGRAIHRASQSFSMDALWLDQALNRTMEVHRPVAEHFVGWANRCNLLEDMTLLQQGVRAWVDGDFVKCVSVLIPQIELALRTIVGRIGRPTTKAHPSVKAASVVINMGDILYNEELRAAFGPDISLHFITLYADPRGHNLRNQMAHGTLGVEEMHRGIANLLIHTLLVLGVWDELVAASLKRQGTQTDAEVAQQA